MTGEQEKDLAEAVLRTRHWSFRQAYPEIQRAVRRILAGDEARRDEPSRGADRMIRDYREIISRMERRPLA